MSTTTEGNRWLFDGTEDKVDILWFKVSQRLNNIDIFSLVDIAIYYEYELNIVPLIKQQSDKLDIVDDLSTSEYTAKRLKKTIKENNKAVDAINAEMDIVMATEPTEACSQTTLDKRYMKLRKKSLDMMVETEKLQEELDNVKSSLNKISKLCFIAKNPSGISNIPSSRSVNELTCYSQEIALVFVVAGQGKYFKTSLKQIETLHTVIASLCTSNVRTAITTSIYEVEGYKIRDGLRAVKLILSNVLKLQRLNSLQVMNAAFQSIHSSLGKNIDTHVTSMYTEWETILPDSEFEIREDLVRKLLLYKCCTEQPTYESFAWRSKLMDSKCTPAEIVTNYMTWVRDNDIDRSSISDVVMYTRSLRNKGRYNNNRNSNNNNRNNHNRNNNKKNNKKNKNNNYSNNDDEGEALYVTINGIRYACVKPDKNFFTRDLEDNHSTTPDTISKNSTILYTNTVHNQVTKAVHSTKAAVDSGASRHIIDPLHPYVTVIRTWKQPRRFQTLSGEVDTQLEGEVEIQVGKTKLHLDQAVLTPKAASVGLVLSMADLNRRGKIVVTKRKKWFLYHEDNVYNLHFHHDILVLDLKQNSAHRKPLATDVVLRLAENVELSSSIECEPRHC